MRTRPSLALVLAALVLTGAAPPPAPEWVNGADLEVTADISPRGSFELCVGETERLFVGVRVEAISILGFRRFDVGTRAADIAVLEDGRPVTAPHTTYTVVPVRFDRTGRHTVRVEPSNLDFGQGNVFYNAATVEVNVIECHFLVEARGVIHMNDGGFQPVLGGVIDSTKLSWNAAASEYQGTGTETNVAVAFPRGGCKARFNVAPSTAHLRGYLSGDGASFHLSIDWDQSTARLEAEGVQCYLIGGGRSNTFIIKPYSGDLPAHGVTTANAPLETWTIDTDGKVYSGFIFVALTKVRGP